MQRDRGEVSLVVCLAGAAATALPVVVAATATDVGTGIAFWAGVIIAVLAAGTGMWRLVRAIYHWGRKIEETFDGVATLKTDSERMEKRQLAMQQQLRDVSERLESGIAQSREIFAVAEQNRQAATAAGIEGLQRLPHDPTL